MWEAFEHAAFYGLDNLTAIIDVNRLGQRGETMHGWDLDSYANRAKAFGWHAIEIDGHDVEAIDRAFGEAAAQQEPADGDRRAHAQGQGRQGGRGQAGLARQGARPPRGGDRGARRRAQHRRRGGEAGGRASRIASRSTAARAADLGARRGGRDAAGLRRRAGGARLARGDVVALDGEVSNSTYAEIFRDAHPDRYFEMYIAEQQMVAAAVGLQVRKLGAVRLDLRGLPQPRLRLHPHGRDQPGEHPPLRLARRRLDRRGRALADGARGPRHDARRPRLDRALPERRQPDGQAGRRDGRPRRDRLHAHHARGDAGRLRRRRGVPDRRLARAARGRRPRDRGRRDHAARVAEGGRAARRRGHRGARDRPLLGQAGRRARRCAPRPRRRAGGS